MSTDSGTWCNLCVLDKFSKTEIKMGILMQVIYPKSALSGGQGGEGVGEQRKTTKNMRK